MRNKSYFLTENTKCVIIQKVIKQLSDGGYKNGNYKADNNGRYARI